MKELLSIYKPIGITPLQLIQQLRHEKPEYENVKIGYAGRLDPMAHGVMLLMVGKETKNRAHYLSLPKAYTFSVLFGVETDTYDVLGLARQQKLKDLPINARSIANLFVKNRVGTHLQTYPPYSSKPVQGKPLFWWAKNNKLDEIEIPEHLITIERFKVTSYKKIEGKALQNQITKTISKIKGDFRQKEIIEHWNNFFTINNNQMFSTGSFTIQCSSGTYVRSIAHELGKDIGCGAITLDIFRTKIGNYRIEDII